MKTGKRKIRAAAWALVLAIMLSAMPAFAEETEPLSELPAQTETAEQGEAVPAAAESRLRKRGVEVAAVFLGDTYGVRYLKRIYGSAFIRILRPENFPDAVIGLLLRILTALKEK